MGVSAILGEPLDTSLGALADDISSCSEIVRLLRSPLRELRARAMATSVAEVVVRLDEMRLR